MGPIRFFLALSVVFAHVGSERAFGFVSGKIAVEIFFSISGFYMAMVMGKYLSKPGGVSTFYKARYLRLFPAYIVTFLILIVFFRPIGDIGDFAPVTQIYTYFVSFSMLGYETLNWFGYSRGEQAVVLLDTIALTKGRPVSLDMLPYMRHMWSVGIEISFYLVAPFVISTRRRALVFAATSMLMHFLISSNFGSYHPLSYRSFFSFAYLFGMGAVAYFYLYPRIVKAVTHLSDYKPHLLTFLYFVLLVLFFLEKTIVQPYGVMDVLYKDLFISGCLFLSLAIFALCKDSKLDNVIGDLSYPIYVVHWPLVRVALWDFNEHDSWVLIGVASSVLAAIAINLFIERPVQKYRVRLGSRA